MRRSVSGGGCGFTARVALLALAAVPIAAARADLRSEIEALIQGQGGVLADGRIDPKVAVILRQAGLVERVLRTEGFPPVTAVRPTELKVIEPWIFNVQGGVGVIITDVLDDVTSPGHDGFRDAALAASMLPIPLNGAPAFCAGPDPVCDAWSPFGYYPLRTPFNTGQIIVIYLPDSDGFVGDAAGSEQDDSLLYIGLDIANGDPHAVIEGLVQRLMDVQLIPPSAGQQPTRENNGLPKIWPDPDNFPDQFHYPVMVPFDADGDGSTSTLTRFNVPWGEYLPRFDDADVRGEKYGFELLLCARQADPGLRTEERFERLELAWQTPTTLAAYFIYGNVPPGPGTLETWPPIGVGNMAALLNARGNDGLSNDDVEFVVRKVDSWVYHNGYAGSEPFEKFRLRLAQGGVRTISDSDIDRSPEDAVRAFWKMPLPALEVKKFVACADTGREEGVSPDAALVSVFGDDVAVTADRAAPVGAMPGTEATELLREPSGPVAGLSRAVRVVAGSLVEFFIEVENTGNVPLDVTLYDEMEAVCGGTKFVYQAILGGANGVCNTTAAGDDIQYVAPNQPAGPGGVVILPGPNGRLDTNPAGDDVRFNPQLQVLLDRTELAIFDGGNGIAETPARPNTDDIQAIAVGQSAPPFCEIVQPGPDDVLNTTTTQGDDVRRNNVLRPNIPVTFGNAVCLLGTNAFFGGPAGNQFLINAGATPPRPTRLGVLRGQRVCTNAAGGDVVRIRFRAIVLPGPEFCNGCIGTSLDARNKIRAIGSPVAGQVAFTPIQDDFDVIDTLRERTETPPADDNVVGVDVYCRGLRLQKDVALCPTCNTGDPCGAFQDQIVVPNGPFPLCIRYRYTVTNTGELDEEVVLSDDFLCNDVQALGPGVQYLSDCTVCSSSVPIVVPVGQTVTRYCTIRFADEAALRAFLRQDDVPPGAARTCGALDLPGQSQTRCYTNCGRATGRASGYPSAPGVPFCPLDYQVTVFDTAQVCGCCATIDVTKDAACLTGDTPGPYSDPLDNLVPGSRARFRVRICNTSTEGTPVSRLRITDTLAGTPAACVTLVAGSAVFRRGAQVCATPGGFNIVGTPFEWDLATCGGDLLPGQCVEFTFDVRIADNATENCDPVNTVRVEAQPNCGPGVPPFWCGEDTDTASINVKRVGPLTCTKEWQAEWDSDLNCQPGPATTAYSSSLSLCDLVFPIRLRLRVTAQNGGEVPLSVTPTDAILCGDCVRNTPGVTFESSEICPIPPDPPYEPVTKVVPPGGTATWTVVLRVDTAAAMRALAANCDLSIDNRPDYFKNRVTLGAALTGDVCPGNPVPGGPPCEAEIRVPDCALTIDKKVKCADDPDTAYANAIEALPGAVVTYRIIICNPAGECRSKLPVIDLYDLLINGTPDPNSVVAKIGAVDVTPCVRPLPTNGSVKRIRLAPCRPAAPWLAPGECLVITFNATMPAGDPPLPNCQANPNAESLNRARAVGYPEACDPPVSSGCDAQPVAGADVCVTQQQDPQHYSHWVCAKVNVKVPKVECRKEVQLDFNNDGTPDTGFLTEAYANCNAFPLAITYRWTARNVGETGLTGVRVCDLPLLTAVCNANTGQAPENQIQFVSCALCDGACCPPSGNDGCAPLPDLPTCGAEASAQCKIIVPNWEAWLRLTGNQQCLTNTSQVQARAIVPPPLCDFNANVNAAPSTCSATVCVAPPCNISVDKQLRCTTSCGGAGQGSFVDGPLDVVPGSGFEFTFKVRNLDTPPYAEQICELEITDTLTGPTNWNPATWIPCEYWPSNCESGQPIDIPQCFKADGTPYRVILPQPMQPSGCLRVKPGVFKPCIPANPVGDRVTNTVVVRGAPGIWVQNPQGQWSLQCTAGAEPFCCSSTDTVTLNIKRPAVACVKEWCAQWDSNASGAIDAGDATLPCTSNLDLCLAVFPVRLTLRVTANNTGNVDLLVTPNDQGAINCMEARGASVGACELRPPVAKTVPAGGNATWTCVIDVPNAQVMRDIAEFCDTLIDNRPRVFVNRVTLTGVPTGVCPGSAIESGPCEAEIRAPEPCALTIDKRVKCLPEDDAAYRYLAQALPGARVKYRVQICNLAGVCQPRVPQIDLRDVFCNAGAVDATTVRADVNGVDVTACLPAPLNFTGGANYIRFGSCLPGRPWLEPGECLTVTFEATMPAGIPPVNCVSNPTPECRNRARAVGYTEALTPPPATLPRCNANPVTGAFTCVTQQQDPQNWPYWVCADVDVRVPQVACTKLVSADLDNNGTYEVGPAPQIDFILDSNTVFPIRIRFAIRARNTGEVPLGPVTIDDNGLAAAAINAGVAPADIVCSPGGPPWTVATLTNCGDTSDEFGCEITFRTADILRAFLTQDDDQSELCFTNRADVTGTPIPGTVCGTAGNVSSQCTAQVCVVDRVCCPPIVKAVADIWNQNEIRMGNTERCICAWDETLLSRWTLETGKPNNFLKQFLHTDRGRARIDGLRSVVVCGPESQAWPLLGVSMKLVRFGSDVTQAGAPLTALGEERGLILVPRGSVPRGKGAGDALTQLERWKLSESGVPDETPGGRNLENDVPQTRRADTTEKGSFLAFLKVEIKWDGSGRLIQDTFLQLSNDGSSDVHVKIFQVNDSHPDCPAIDNTIVLTHDEPAYWAASTGQPKGVSPFTLLDPQGDPDPDPLNPGGRIIRGYIIAYAVNSTGEEVRWNHLTGAATIVNYALRSAWEYNPWSFRAWSAEEGQVLAGNPGQLEFDGVEYDWAPARLHMDFFAPGAVIRSGPGKTVIVEDTDLTLWAMFRDLSEF